jgi:hypothetical protein
MVRRMRMRPETAALVGAVNQSAQVEDVDPWDFANALKHVVV